MYTFLHVCYSRDDADNTIAFSAATLRHDEHIKRLA
jgi:hypothetical protein